MAPPSSLSAVQSTTPVMASNLTDGVLLVIKTYKLQNFLNSRTVPPPQLISGDNGVLQENLEFTRTVKPPLG
ncbi:hypothetical protein Gotur_024073 [Gossypium turneri]